MHLREAPRGRGLVALAFLALAACPIGPQKPPSAPVEASQSSADLRERLRKLADRTDYEASIQRARIYARLRVLEPDAWDLMARGDAADVDLMAMAAPPEYKAESAGRLHGHFRERALNPAHRRSALSGTACEPLHRYILLWISAMVGEYLSAAECAEGLTRLAEAAKALAAATEVRPAGRRDIEGRAEAWSRRSAELRAAVAVPEPDRQVRRFCELDLARHLEEATRAADQGGREKVGRGEEGRVIDWYLESLAHFVLVRECLAEPTPAQENALATMEIVVRVLSDLFCREP